MSLPGLDSESSRVSSPSGNGVVGDIWVNFKRWNRKAIRDPTAVFLDVVMAVLSLLMFAAVFGEAGALALEQSGLGDVGYVSFLVPAVLIQVSMASSVSSGMGLVEDLQTGMFEKVVVTPMNWTAVFAGKAAAELLRIVLQVLIVFGLALTMGARIETGLPGALGIVFVCLLFGTWYMSLSNILALLTRDQEALDAAAYALLFPLLFISSAFLPVSSLSGPTQMIAKLNPVTYAVDAVRALVLDRDVMTVLEISEFGGIYDTLVPALAVLVTLNIVFGTTTITMLSRASSSKAD
ncbi:MULTISPECIES: ABC transporter permease [Salinibaculum]|uniref:ABC transporter permease n=1 Tax=Salinibaculum TaxID=2732368 RepID=UPI0030D48912